jgi:hypothetical protein
MSNITEITLELELGNVTRLGDEANEAIQIPLGPYDKIEIYTVQRSEDGTVSVRAFVAPASSKWGDAVQVRMLRQAF